MKKFISILLVVLYLVSLSGMIRASDCKALESYKKSSGDFNVPCSNSNGHAANSHSHPLQQFCKLMEVHKEILVSGQQQPLSYYPSQQVPSKTHLYPVTFAAFKRLQPQIPFTTRLFLQYRVLLI